jgi:hypothetical protein
MTGGSVAGAAGAGSAGGWTQPAHSRSAIIPRTMQNAVIKSGNLLRFIGFLEIPFYPQLNKKLPILSQE